MTQSNVKDVIFKYCQPFLKQVGDSKLYRGMKPNNVLHDHRLDVDFTYGYVDNRMPKHTSKELHKSFNKAFIKEFNTPFRDGVMCTGDYMTAEGYGGNVYEIYPVGEFKFCWSPDIEDLYLYYELHGNLDMEDYLDLDNKALDEVKSHYKITDLKQAIKSNNEIMIYCDKVIVAKA